MIARSLKLPTFDLRTHRRLLDQSRLPLLITGVAGVAGFNAFAFFRQLYGDQVVGQRPQRNWPLSGPGIIGLDLENKSEIRSLIQSKQFKTVLNCGGSCALKGCELDPAMAERVNVAGVQSLLDAMEGTSIRFVHLSIDLVFSGTRGGNLSETDWPDPVTVYGKTMLQAERLITDRRPDSCILRISLPMGISFNGHAGAIDWIQSRFAAGKPATLYFDEVRTPTYVECLNELVEAVLADDCSGLYHAGGPRQLSLYQIAQIVNVAGGYDPALLQGCYRIEAGPIPPRAGNVTMDSTLLRKLLGRPEMLPWPADPRLVPDCRDWHLGESTQMFAGSPKMLESELYFRPAAGPGSAPG